MLDISGREIEPGRVFFTDQHYYHTPLFGVVIDFDFWKDEVGRDCDIKLLSFFSQCWGNAKPMVPVRVLGTRVGMRFEEGKGFGFNGIKTVIRYTCAQPNLLIPFEGLTLEQLSVACQMLSLGTDKGSYLREVSDEISVLSRYMKKGYGPKTMNDDLSSRHQEMFEFFDEAIPLK